MAHTPENPIVTIICTLYNQADFLQETLASVTSQTYSSIELIIINNASADQSVRLVNEFISTHPEVIFIDNKENIGLCKAFNHALKRCKGKYIVDLSGDDILLPDRIEKQVRHFQSLPPCYGAIFSNATFINEKGAYAGVHYPVNHTGKSKKVIPAGDIFTDVLSRYFICTPTLMFRKSVLEALSGYDESLSYEDFDILIRMAREYALDYQDEILTRKRLHRNAHSMTIISKQNALLPSTLQICFKAYHSCKSPAEYKALSRRTATFIRKCFYCENFELVFRFSELHAKITRPGVITRFIILLSRYKIRVNSLYIKYISIKQILKYTLNTTGN